MTANSEKGANFLGRIKHLFAVCEKTPYKAAIRGNSTLVKPTRFNPFRDEFMLRLTKDNFNALVKKYLKNKTEKTKQKEKTKAKTSKHKSK